MNAKKILGSFMAIALLILPAITFANTYQFFDTRGNLQSMQAASFAEALATAPQLGVHSGVMLVTATSPQLSTPIVTAARHYYWFVDTRGDLQGVWALNAAHALATAPQLGVHSGVMLVQ